jgi:hypothetical protein
MKITGSINIFYGSPLDFQLAQCDDQNNTSLDDAAQAADDKLGTQDLSNQIRWPEQHLIESAHSDMPAKIWWIKPR